MNEARGIEFTEELFDYADSIPAAITYDAVINAIMEGVNTNYTYNHSGEVHLAGEWIIEHFRFWNAQKFKR